MLSFRPSMNTILTINIGHPNETGNTFTNENVKFCNDISSDVHL